MVGLATGRGAFCKWGGLRKTKPEGGFYSWDTAQEQTTRRLGLWEAPLLPWVPQRSHSSPFGHFGADPGLSQLQTEFSSPGPPAPAHLKQHHQICTFPTRTLSSCRLQLSLGAFPALERREIPGEGLTRFVVGFAVVNQTAPPQKKHPKPKKKPQPLPELTGIAAQFPCSRED